MSSASTPRLNRPAPPAHHSLAAAALPFVFALALARPPLAAAAALTVLAVAFAR